MLEPCNAKVLRTVLRGLGAVIAPGYSAVASPNWRPHYLAGNGADFSLVLERETIGGTDVGSKGK